MKKMLLLLRWPCLLQDVLNRRLLFKQTGSSSTKGNHHPSFFSFWNWAEENCRCSQNLWRRRNVVKTENPAKHSVNGLLGFITLGICSLCFYCSLLNCMSVYRYSSSSALLINILLGSFQLFLHSRSASLLRVK